MMINDEKMKNDEDDEKSHEDCNMMKHDGKRWHMMQDDGKS